MKKNAVHIGATYTAKVSGKIVRIRIDAESPYGGWDATNLGTRKTIRVKSAQRLRAEVIATPRPVGQRNATVANVATDDASSEGAHPGPNEVVNAADEHGNAGDEVAEATEAGDQETDDMATKTKSKNGTSKKTGRAATKAPASREIKPKAAAARETKTAASAKAPATRKAKTATNGDATTKRVSAIDAAAVILKAKGEPMRSREIITAMATQSLWTSPGGQTPHATLDAAMRREINTKGKDARFTIEGRGLFGFSGKASA